MNKQTPEDSPISAEMLSAYLDAELQGDELARVEAALASDPSLQSELDSLAKVRDAVKALPVEGAGDDFALNLKRRLLADGIEMGSGDEAAKAAIASNVSPSMTLIKGDKEARADAALQDLSPRSIKPMLVAAAMMFAVAFLTIFLPKMLMDNGGRSDINQTAELPLDYYQQPKRTSSDVSDKHGDSALLPLPAKPMSPSNYERVKDLLTPRRAAITANFDDASTSLVAADASAGVDIASVLAEAESTLEEAEGAGEALRLEILGASEPSEKRMNSRLLRMRRDAAPVKKAHKWGANEAEVKADPEGEAVKAPSAGAANPSELKKLDKDAGEQGKALLLEGDIEQVARTLLKLKIDSLAKIDVQAFNNDTEDDEIVWTDRARGVAPDRADNEEAGKGMAGGGAGGRGQPEEGIRPVNDPRELVEKPLAEPQNEPHKERKPIDAPDKNNERVERAVEDLEAKGENKRKKKAGVKSEEKSVNESLSLEKAQGSKTNDEYRARLEALMQELRKAGKERVRVVIPLK